MKKLFSIFVLLFHIPLLLPDAIQDATFFRIQRGNRRFNTKNVRATATHQQVEQALEIQVTNGDEERYADKRASFGKSLRQLNTGFIDVNAFNQMVFALQCSSPESFLNITMGTSPVQRRLVNPQAAYAFNFDGPDGWVNSMPPAPALASAEAATEMAEVYWQALARDVFFNDYSTDPITLAAAADLNTFSNFKGPKQGGVVTPATLFRGNTPGDLIGPFISQFLYVPVPYGPEPNFDSGVSGTPGIDFQAQVVPEPLAVAQNDFMTIFDEWHFIQQGNFPTRSITYTTDRIFIRNGRDLGDYVHQDTPQQALVNAALILLNFGEAALDQRNPYINNPTQEAFVTYGIADILYLTSVAVEIALRAAWYQKWIVHRRLRPEFFAFLVNQQVTGIFNAGINSELINSLVLPAVFAHNAALTTNAGMGTYFLPMAYPEGSPMHPSYPAGHATLIGAGVTMLKAFFNERFVVPNPLQPNAANTMLEAYVDTPLTVGNELNKLASNISLGRDDAGVHYRSDGIEGMLLGEKVAIALLENEAWSRNINFDGFSLTTFAGTKIIIGAKKTAPQLS